MSDIISHQAFAPHDDASRIAGENARRLTDGGRQALQFGLGLQRAVIEEMTQASTEMLERLHAELDIAAELIARVASSHSIHELSTAIGDCGQHQAEAFRIDSQLMMKHSQRLCERALLLLSGSEG